MIRLELTQEDADILATTLESALSDLRFEIADTDSLDFREGLKRRKHALNRTLEALTAARRTA